MENVNQQLPITPPEFTQDLHPVAHPDPTKIIANVIIITTLILIGVFIFLMSKKQSVNQHNQQIKKTALLSPTPSSTTNLKTYTSNEGSFSFSYPSFYILHINELSGFESSYKRTKNALELEDVSNNANESNSNYPYDIKIIFKTVNPNETITTLSQNDNICKPIPTANQIPNQPIPIINREQILVDTGQAIVCEAESAGGYNTDIDILNKNIAYNITISSGADQAFVKRFLSTFKFTN